MKHLLFHLKCIGLGTIGLCCLFFLMFLFGCIMYYYPFVLLVFVAIGFAWFIGITIVEGRKLGIF